MKTLSFVLSIGIACLLSCSAPQTEAQSAEEGNHLSGETSPYLLQHANNPVDWYPWGEAALEKAERENKLLIISIGYAACHWCHVMERESFEDTTVARIMNEHFVAIKVDREERPDIDDVYMTACQMASGDPCGWPLNVFAMPDGRPVWAGTYSPKKQWIEILKYFIDLREAEPGKLDEYADRLRAGIAASDTINIRPLETESFPARPLENMVQNTFRQWDFQRGGMKGAPKFPMPRGLEFLLNYHYYSNDEKALKAVLTTLDAMATGGIYDQLGGGFARYSTDADWHVPHFEKMLYDNAQLVSLYAHAFQLTGQPRYRKVIRETLDFVEREMTSPDGAFYSSLDADSEDEEGKFYTWTEAQINSALGNGAATDIVKAYYRIRPSGNWEQGKNILDPDSDVETLARKFDRTEEEIRQSLAQSRATLWQSRSRRERPALDNKVLTAWNALMLKACLDAFNALGDSTYLNAALRNAAFIEQFQLKEDGRLLRSYNDGQSSINGFLDDYGLTARAFLSLYQATFDERWIWLARRITNYAVDHFSNPETGLFYYTSDEDPALVARKMELEDNVIPASNSTMARVLYDLGHYLYHPAYLKRSEQMLRRIAGGFGKEAELAYLANWALLYLDYLSPPFEVAIVGPDFAARRSAMMKHFLPNALFLGGAGEGQLQLLRDKLRQGRTMIYVCQDKVCKLPVEEVEAALKMLE